MNLLSINDLSNDDVLEITKQALALNVEGSHLAEVEKSPVAFIFLEPSTRTRVSFERAAQISGRRYVLINNLGSSIEKGETLEDTVLNLGALGMKTFVIRNNQESSIQKIANKHSGVFINAGDGTNEHPTQALLDFATLYEAFDGQLEGKKVAVIGDLRHSRVARSFSMLAKRFGIQLCLISPSAWKPFAWGEDLAWHETLDDVLKEQDVVMALRVQRERMDNVEEVLLQNFVSQFQLSASRFSPNQKLMHPGPVNWGVELSPDLKGDSRSLILRQAAIGLSVRAVIMDYLEK